MLIGKSTITEGTERFKMLNRMKIPNYAKVSARKGLENRKKSDMTGKESKALGVYLGLDKAKKLIRNKYIDEKEMRSVARFYKNNKNKKSKKYEDLLLLWGGRKFGLFLSKIY